MLSPYAPFLIVEVYYNKIVLLFVGREVKVKQLRRRPNMFSNPQSNISQFNLQHGARVADIGVGSGFYSIEAARAIGPGGRVYAIDVQKDLLTRLKNEAHRQHLSNIEVFWGDAEKIGGTKLASGLVDAAIVSNILFQVPDKTHLAEEVKRILKPKGRVLIIDWSDSYSAGGPPQKDLFNVDAARSLFEGVGLHYENRINAGSHHYGIILRKP